MKLLRAAVFLDRDGVLIEDRGLLVDPAGIHILPGVPAALRKLKEAGFFLAVVSNQAVVARGLISPRDLDALNSRIRGLLQAAGAPPLDAAYFCPHHPEAALPQYRVVCDCRKPRPGSLLRAAREHGLDLAASFMVGDRMTDVAAGAAAGCRTVLVQTGQHDAPPIFTALTPGAGTMRSTVAGTSPGGREEDFAAAAKPQAAVAASPNHICADLPAAADWILGER